MVGVHHPEPMQVSCHLQRGFCLFCFNCPVQRRAQVIAQAEKTMEPFELIRSAYFFSPLLSQIQEISQMPIAYFCFLAHSSQTIPCEFLNGHQHGVMMFTFCLAVRTTLQEALIEQ